jgi:beta-lactamase superfamily II metal-dependent hydrolase
MHQKNVENLKEFAKVRDEKKKHLDRSSTFYLNVWERTAMIAQLARWGLFAAAVLGFGIVAEAGQPAPTRGLEIYFIDVDGGAATLLVTPDRESILIDSGWPGRSDRDPKRIVHALKDLAGRDRLDHLITTHWHTDHFGGVAGLARMVEIAHFWDRGLPEDVDSDRDFPDGPRRDDPEGIAYRAASAGKRKALRAGDSLPLSGVKSVVLASGGHVIDAAAARRFRETTESAGPNPQCDSAPPDQRPDPSDNARSLAFLFSLGKFQFFDAGDLTWNVEKRLACPIDLVGPVDLYQVTHHGMDISNHPTLVRTIAPLVTIMNNGPRKGGAPATVRLLRSVSSIQAAYQLHRNAATGEEDNTEPSLIANKDASGGQFIRVRVEPDGARFTVRIGEDGPERTFESK